MKKMIASLLFVLIAPNAFADHVALYSSQCSQVNNGSGETYGGCFHNIVAQRIKASIDLREDQVLNNGQKYWNKSSLVELIPNSYIDTFFHRDYFTQNNLQSLSFSLEKNGKMIPGCKFTIGPNESYGKTVINLIVKKDSMYCE